MAASEQQIAVRLRENLARVRETIARAAARSGRPAESVMLVGVTKYVEPALARLLVEAGLDQLGESRPQELWRKAEALADCRVFWHLVGHLQRNKVKRTTEIATLIHSADSLRLLQEINTHAAKNPLPVCDVLLEVNVSGDVAKHGFRANEIEPLIAQIAPLKHVAVLGLMTMAGLESSPDQTRREFAALRELRDKIGRVHPPNMVLNELSMGMSGDFEIAIEEGATIVRVGSALFEGLEP
jgi:pyridoxal phosphate enzyme (YggS family)